MSTEESNGTVLEYIIGSIVILSILFFNFPAETVGNIVVGFIVLLVGLWVLLKIFEGLDFFQRDPEKVTRGIVSLLTSPLLYYSIVFILAYFFSCCAYIEVFSRFRVLHKSDNLAVFLIWLTIFVELVFYFSYEKTLTYVVPEDMKHVKRGIALISFLLFFGIFYMLGLGCIEKPPVDGNPLEVSFFARVMYLGFRQLIGSVLDYWLVQLCIAIFIFGALFLIIGVYVRSVVQGVFPSIRNKS